MNVRDIKRKRSLYRNICTVDNAVTDLGAIMKRFVQTGNVPVCNNMIDVYQYGNDDESIDAKRIELGEDANAVAKNPSDSFTKLTDEELDLIPDAPTSFLNIDEYGKYAEESYSANERAKSFYRAKQREAEGKSLMSHQQAVGNAVKIAESLGYKKESVDVNQ